jgi:hypothetical protein
LGDCPTFESWIVIKREQYRNLVLQALSSLADFHLNRQEFDLAQQYAARQIEIIRCRARLPAEDAALACMEGAQPLKVYTACRSMLKDDWMSRRKETEKSLLDQSWPV